MYSNDLFQYYSTIVLDTIAGNSSTEKNIVVPISFSKILYVGISQNDTVDTCTGGGRLNIHYIWYPTGNNINVRIINNGNYDGWNQFYVSIIGII